MKVNELRAIQHSISGTQNVIEDLVDIRDPNGAKERAVCKMFFDLNQMCLDLYRIIDKEAYHGE